VFVSTLHCFPGKIIEVRIPRGQHTPIGIHMSIFIRFELLGLRNLITRYPRLRTAVLGQNAYFNIPKKEIEKVVFCSLQNKGHVAES